MAKKRIHQIAKELDVASADVLFHAKELGFEVKTASSGLTGEEEELVKLSLFPEVEEKKDVVEDKKDEPEMKIEVISTVLISNKKEKHKRNEKKKH